MIQNSKDVSCQIHCLAALLCCGCGAEDKPPKIVHGEPVYHAPPGTKVDNLDGKSRRDPAGAPSGYKTEGLDGEERDR